MASQVTKRGISTAMTHMSAGAGAGGEHAAGSYKLWKKLSFFVAVPACGLIGLNTVLEHNKMTTHRPEFVKYDYLRVRTKRFPWGDGNKSFFHNPHVNALPEGYEDDGHH